MEQAIFFLGLALGTILGVVIMCVFKVSKISTLEDENWSLSKKNADLTQELSKIKGKAHFKSDTEKFKSIETHISSIIGITDDERVLAECNLIQQELGDDK